MFEETTYCPYTGLRSFTEEEAIYFKGRDSHIEEATKQLEERKFLMLTGASGDGKSSLVYAGIVPHAKAGFLKSQFSNWVIADFKPERTPFYNLCRSLAKHLGIANLATVEAELSYGFSSLVELYKNSKYYHDKNSKEWQEADDQKKQNLRRSSANLLILADQFEEFFTNEENYFNGAVSQKSNLVVNLLLETARIAQEENLPIYVVCTMRSDYIGQCAAFRGLPEFIGYSQFFVPRLNRLQLQEAIEEPALLSGIQISKRLVDRLIHDITEGIDQLPILQHALNQIWRAADNGQEELDLIHYAMVGGMSGDDLPFEDQARYSNWYSGLEMDIRPFYAHPGMRNVLNTHANKLYTTIAEAYKEKTSEDITEEDARQIIHNTFVCLTKVDHARAVRNRMTLQEISNITDIKGIDPEKVKNISAVFRDAKNTLIQPFIDEDGNDPVGADDILDISHESLIRNWTRLEEWVEEEYDHVNTYRDFKQQVDRWIEHNKSSDYLLPIGTLSHFEEWFNHIKPNKYWINRYHDEIENKELRLAKAEEILNDSKEFLSLSAKNHRITRAVMRYGAKKLAMAAAILAILLFSSFYVYDEYSKSEKVILQKVYSEGIGLLSDKNADLFNKRMFITSMLRSDPDNWNRIFSTHDVKNAYKQSLTIATDVLLRAEYRDHPLLLKSLVLADSLLTIQYSTNQKDSLANEFLQDHFDLVHLLELVNYYRSEKEISQFLQKNSRKVAEYVLGQFRDTKDYAPDARLLNDAIELSLNNKCWNAEEILEIIHYMSPIDGEPSEALKSNYSAGKTINTTTSSSKFDHAGLFQELAYLYAALGKSEKALQCIDTLSKYNTAYQNRNYRFNPDNATQVSAYFLMYNQDVGFADFTEKYVAKTGHNALDFFDQLAGRTSLSIFQSDKVIFDNNSNYMANPVLGLSGFAMRTRIFEHYLREINRIADPVQKEFRLALYYKNYGLFTAQQQILTSGKFDTIRIFDHYKKALEHYAKVPADYLNQITPRAYWGGRLNEYKRREQFLFPGYMELQIIWVPRAYSFTYFNSSFLQYLVEQNKVNDLYTESTDLDLINEWTSIYNSSLSSRSFRIGQAEFSMQTLYDFYKEIRTNPIYNRSVLTQMKVLIANYLFESDFPEEGIAIAGDIHPDYLDSSLPDIFEGVRQDKYKTMADLIVHLKMHGEDDVFERFIRAFPNPENRSSLYSLTASHLAKNEMFDSARVLIEKAKMEGELATEGFQSYKYTLLYALAYLPNLEAYKEIRSIWKNLMGKNFIDLPLATAHAYNGFSWRAYEDLDQNLPADDKIRLYYSILQGYNWSAKRGTVPDYWKIYDQSDPWFMTPFNYVNN